MSVIWLSTLIRRIVLPESDSDTDHDSKVETDYDSSEHWVYVLLRRLVK